MTNHGDHNTVDHDGVRWLGNGRYTPTCPICAWNGKQRYTRSDAAAAVRSHLKTHRSAADTNRGTHDQQR